MAAGERRGRAPWGALGRIEGAVEVTTAAVHDSLFLRLWFILLNLSSIYFGYVFARKLIKPVMAIYLTLNVLAVLMNVFGRMSLAKSFTGTAIIGISPTMERIFTGTSLPWETEIRS